MLLPKDRTSLLAARVRTVRDAVVRTIRGAGVGTVIVAVVGTVVVTVGSCATTPVVPGATTGLVAGGWPVASAAFCPYPPAGLGGASADARLIDRGYDPKRFAQGADPSRDPECRAPNPERGFFAFRDLLALADLDELRGQGVTLIYGQVLLSAYRDRALDAAVIERLRAGFAAVRRAGLKVIPRFYYAADDKAPDARPSQALAHIEVLAPLLRDNADVIAAMHAGFVGAWGEWHPENRATLAERKRIVEALLAALPSDRSVLVRRPFYKQTLFGGPMTAELAGTTNTSSATTTTTAALSAAPAASLARIGHLNDCFLASKDDLGTYRAPGEEAYALSDSRFVTVGGETCAVNPPRSECKSALAELQRHHWSFLNRDYHRDVLASWQRGGCQDTVACRLGYRLLVLGFTLPKSVRAGEPVSVRVAISNDGFARAINPRPVTLAFARLTASGANAKLSAPVLVPTAFDAREIFPGQDVEACLGGVLPKGADLHPGAYQVGIALPDPAPSLRNDPRYAVRLGGGVRFDATTGINWLDAQITVVR